MEGRPPKRDSFLPASPSFVILEGAKDARLLIWFDVMGPNVLRLLLSMLAELSQLSSPELPEQLR